MKILVRLPNWLGDMVMSVGFIHQLNHFFPGCEVSVIAKKGIHELLSFFPPLKHHYIFSKEEYTGFTGLWNFGKKINRSENFDLFFCLPDSLSSAFMGKAIAAKKRIGYKKEMREIFLTHAFRKPKKIHRVEEYIKLLELYTNQSAAEIDVQLQHSFIKKDHVVVNINSEAFSRRLTIAKAVEIIGQLRKTLNNKIVLIGAPKEKEFVDAVLGKLDNIDGIESIAGKTSLSQLVEVLASAQLMLTTDSGPAHLANALNTQTIILFGAGNENNTSPYNRDFKTVLRLGKLSCEPCEKNICIQFGTPQCLELLETNTIVNTVIQNL